MGFQFTSIAVFLVGSRKDRLLECLQNHLFIDRLLFNDQIDGMFKVEVRFHFYSPSAL
jgi:hypothetical protein